MKRIRSIITAIMAAIGSARVALANEGERQGMVGLANEVSASDEWFQVTPLGDFPHKLGLQRVDKEAVAKMANEFNSMAGRLQRAFVGRPIYQGHPDVDPQAYRDRKAYGWMKQMEAREDGLWAKAEWSPEGKAMVESGHYKFHSPYWDGDLIGQEKNRKVYRPSRVISAGLTNEPNIPVNPLANEKEENDMQLAVLAAALGLANTATEAEVTTEINRLAAEAKKVTALANEKLQAEQGRDAEKTKLANVAKQRNDLMLDAAIASGVITIAQRGEYETKLANDFESASAELKAKKPALKTKTAIADDAAAGRTGIALANSQATAQFEEKVRVRMANTRESFDQAWAHVKSTEPGLYAAMDGNKD